MLRSTLTALAATAALTAGAAPAAATPSLAVRDAAPVRASATGTSFTDRIADLVNAARARHGLAPLRESWCATAYAGGQSTRMAVRRTMFHQSLGPVVRVCQAQWAGENVAWGTWGPDRVVAGWLASPPHRAAVLDPRFTHLGVGASRSLSGPAYSAAVFLDLSR